MRAHHGARHREHPRHAPGARGPAAARALMHDLQARRAGDVWRRSWRHTSDSPAAGRTASHWCEGFADEPWPDAPRTQRVGRHEDGVEGTGTYEMHRSARLHGRARHGPGGFRARASLGGARVLDPMPWYRVHSGSPPEAFLILQRRRTGRGQHPNVAALRAPRTASRCAANTGRMPGVFHENRGVRVGRSNTVTA